MPNPIFDLSGMQGILFTTKLHQVFHFFSMIVHLNYTPIAFDERGTLWLQRAGSLPCVCVRLLHCMHVRLRNGYRKPTRK